MAGDARCLRGASLGSTPPDLLFQLPHFHSHFLCQGFTVPHRFARHVLDRNGWCLCLRQTRLMCLAGEDSTGAKHKQDSCECNCHVHDSLNAPADSLLPHQDNERGHLLNQSRSNVPRAKRLSASRYRRRVTCYSLASASVQMPGCLGTLKSADCRCSRRTSSSNLGKKISALRPGCARHTKG